MTMADIWEEGRALFFFHPKAEESCALRIHYIRTALWLSTKLFFFFWLLFTHVHTCVERDISNVKKKKNVYNFVLCCGYDAQCPFCVCVCSVCLTLVTNPRTVMLSSMLYAYKDGSLRCLRRNSLSHFYSLYLFLLNAISWVVRPFSCLFSYLSALLFPSSFFCVKNRRKKRKGESKKMSWWIYTE